MWDLQTAVQAVVVVAVASLLVPPLARGIGGICAVIGFCGVVQSSSWAPTVMALGMVAWFVGHWSFAVRNDARYRSRLARVVIDQTPPAVDAAAVLGTAKAQDARVTER